MSSRRAWVTTFYVLLLLLHGVHVLEEALTGFRMIETLGMGVWLSGNLTLLVLATLPGWYALFSGTLPLGLLVIYGVIQVLNGLGHVSSALWRGSYDPGCASGVGLIAVGVLLVVAAQRLRPTPTAETRH